MRTLPEMLLLQTLRTRKPRPVQLNKLMLPWLVPPKMALQSLPPHLP
jgi:hypothetical protein